MFIAFKTSSNSDKEAFSPFAHLWIIDRHMLLSQLSIQEDDAEKTGETVACNIKQIHCTIEWIHSNSQGLRMSAISNSHSFEVGPQILELFLREVMGPKEGPELLRPQEDGAAPHTRYCCGTELSPSVKALEPRDNFRVHLFLLRQVTNHPRVIEKLHSKAIVKGQFINQDVYMRTNHLCSDFLQSAYISGAWSHMRIN